MRKERNSGKRRTRRKRRRKTRRGRMRRRESCTEKVWEGYEDEGVLTGAKVWGAKEE